MDIPNAFAFRVEPDIWIATLVDKDIMQQGGTAEEAIERLIIAIQLYKEDPAFYESIPKSPVARLAYVGTT